MRVRFCRVVWGEGAQVSPSPVIRNRGVSPGHPPQERMWPQAQPLMGARCACSHFPQV